MGNFRIEIEAVGGHGCQRDKKDGETVTGCNQMGCPDCEAVRFVKQMKQQGMNVLEARLVHWPGQPSEVVDTIAVDQVHGAVIATRTRQGSF